MHSLALALHALGHTVTGSDDEIFEPSRSRLSEAGILPDTMGWDSSRIHPGLDAIVLGMHAHADNPELHRALELKLPIYSYPEFMRQQSSGKTRVVIGGSHGKTTITSMVMHGLKANRKPFDYLVGALVEGFANPVSIHPDNTIAVFEGDEYLASTLDRRPKFHLYEPHIGLISGIAWDHMNVFPTEENYIHQFSLFIDLVAPEGSLVYCTEDPAVKRLVEQHPRYAKGDINFIPYGTPPYTIQNGVCIVQLEKEEFRMRVFGRHNLQNLEAARTVCGLLGVDGSDFYRSLTDFAGAARRLEKLHETDEIVVFRDFAHAPSKLRATVEAVREQYPGRRLVACMELHTYSSLNKSFLQQYTGSMEGVDAALVYYSPAVVAQKRLPEIAQEDVRKAFGYDGLVVATRNEEVQRFVDVQLQPNTALLLMSSGNWGGGIRHTPA